MLYKTNNITFIISKNKVAFKSNSTNEKEIKQTVIKAYKYKYQGQERQKELNLNWDNFMYRNYDFALGRFVNIDPISEHVHSQSPYVLSNNNPIIFKDYLGLGIFNVIGNLFRRFKDTIHNLFVSCPGGKQYENQSIREAWQTPDFNFSLRNLFPRKKPVVHKNHRVRRISTHNLSAKTIKTSFSALKFLPVAVLPLDLAYKSGQMYDSNIITPSYIKLDIYGNVISMQVKMPTDEKSVNELNQIIKILTTDGSIRLRIDFPKPTSFFNNNSLNSLNIRNRREFQLLARYLYSGGIKHNRISWGHYNLDNRKKSGKKAPLKLKFY